MVVGGQKRGNVKIYILTQPLLIRILLHLKIESTFWVTFTNIQKNKGDVKCFGFVFTQVGLLLNTLDKRNKTVINSFKRKTY